MEGILAGFRNSRSDLLDRVERLEPGLFSRVALHPRMKTPLRLVDHLYFVAEHDDHHLARIWNWGSWILKRHRDQRFGLREHLTDHYRPDSG